MASLVETLVTAQLPSKLLFVPFTDWPQKTTIYPEFVPMVEKQNGFNTFVGDKKTHGNLNINNEYKINHKINVGIKSFIAKDIIQYNV